MVVSEAGRAAAAMTLLFATAIVEPPVITELLVPAQIELDSMSPLSLQCFYNVSDTTDLQVRWLWKPLRDLEAGTHAKLIYSWSPPDPPHLHGELMQLLPEQPAPKYSSSEGSVSRLQLPPPGASGGGVWLSGEYSCEVSARGGITRRASTLTIYSGEHDLRLKAERGEDGGLLVTCSVDRVYPQPDLLLERFGEPLVSQWQRVQQSAAGGGLLDATTSARLARAGRRERFACRLALRHTSYRAVRELLYHEHRYQPTGDHKTANIVASTNKTLKTGHGARSSCNGRSYDICSGHLLAMIFEVGILLNLFNTH